MRSPCRTKLTPALLPSSVHAAVIAINEAVDHGVPEGTLAAMQNPNAMLVNLDPSSAPQYHDTLYQAKGEKVASSRKRVSAPIAGGGGESNGGPRRIIREAVKGPKLLPPPPLIGK